MRISLWLCQSLGNAFVILVPIFWPDVIAKAKTSPFLWYSIGSERHANVAAILVLAGLVISVVSQVLDKRAMARDVSSEMKGVVSDREFMEAYSATVSAAVKIARASSGMTADDLQEARKSLLEGICIVVHHYYDKSRQLGINACCMVAYTVNSRPAGIETRLQLIDKARSITSYTHVLDLMLWARDEKGLPDKLALPVEDPDKPEYRCRLLPGAPAAYALGELFVVEDTHNLDDYFKDAGKDVIKRIKDEQMEFFRDQPYRSFASIPLDHEGQPKGILNVQSRKPHIFGQKQEHQVVVMELLEPLRVSLSILL